MDCLKEDDIPLVKEEISRLVNQWLRDAEKLGIDLRNDPDFGIRIYWSACVSLSRTIEQHVTDSGGVIIEEQVGDD